MTTSVTPQPGTIFSDVSGIAEEERLSDGRHIRSTVTYECGCMLVTTFVDLSQPLPEGQYISGPFISGPILDPASEPPLDPDPVICDRHRSMWDLIDGDIDGMLANHLDRYPGGSRVTAEIIAEGERIHAYIRERQEALHALLAAEREAAN